MGPAHPSAPTGGKGTDLGLAKEHLPAGLELLGCLGHHGHGPSPPHTHGEVQREPLCLSKARITRWNQPSSFPRKRWLCSPCSSLHHHHHHHPRCHLSSCPSWRPLLLFGDCHCPSQSPFGTWLLPVTPSCVFAALRFHHFLFLSLPGL